MNETCHALIKVYLRNAGGAVFSYSVTAPTSEDLTVKAREHVGQIMASGYRHCSNGVLEYFPPHWIDKIKVVGDIHTDYPDVPSGT